MKKQYLYIFPAAILLFSAALVLFFSLSTTEKTLALGTCQEGFKIDPGQIVEIDCHDACRDVRNDSGHPETFAPAKFDMEWHDFRMFAPTSTGHIHLSDCTRTLTLNKNIAAGGTVTSSPAGINCGTACSTQSASFTHGTSVTLTAAEAPGYTFSGWSGSGCSGTGTCTVDMTANRDVTATFNASTYTLTGNFAGTGSGTVTVEPPTPPASYNSNFTRTYDHGTTVTLTAAAAAGSTFAGWSGEGCSGTGTCTVDMTANRTVTATFNITEIDCEQCQYLSGGVCVNATTNWGANLYDCTGNNKRCYNGVCRECLNTAQSYFWSDGCSNCAGQGDMACWRIAGETGTTCDQVCAAFGGCEPADWNDSESNNVANWFVSCHPDWYIEYTSCRAPFIYYWDDEDTGDLIYSCSRRLDGHSQCCDDSLNCRTRLCVCRF